MLGQKDAKGNEEQIIFYPHAPAASWEEPLQTLKPCGELKNLSRMKGGGRRTKKKKPSSGGRGNPLQKKRITSISIHGIGKGGEDNNERKKEGENQKPLRM